MSSAQSYDAVGPLGGPYIVFLHGMRVTRRMWQPQMESLGSELRLIALDLPGHGSLCDEEFHVEHAVDHVAKVVDQAASSRAIVVGLSLGGYIAIEFGARYPQKAAGLVIASASVEPRGWYNLPYRVAATLMSTLPKSWLDAFNRAIFTGVYGKRAEPLVASGFFMRGGAAGVREIMSREYGPKLSAYPGPVLLLNGSMDWGFRMHEKRFLAMAQRGRVEVIPKAFHLSNIDQPEAFSDAVRRFAKSVAC